MEGNLTYLEGEGSEEWLFVKSMAAMAMFVLAHCVTLLVLAVFAKMTHERAELAHPVFAVIFQEIIIIIFCEVSALCILTALITYPENNILLVLYSLPAFTAMQFHQVTWLTVTCLRYAIMIIS